MGLEALEGRKLDPGPIPSDGTEAVLDALARNPRAPVICLYGDAVSEGVFAFPKGSDTDEQVRVAGLCAQHISREDGPRPKVLLLDLTNGHILPQHGTEGLLPWEDLPTYHKRLGAIFAEYSDDTLGEESDADRPRPTLLESVRQAIQYFRGHQA